MQQVETQFPSTASTPAWVRGFLRATLHTWELDGFGKITELLSDELVSNVVRHVGSPMTVRALRQPTSIRVEVDDPSTEPPILRRPDPLEASGRGVFLVDSLANQWGTEMRDDGKTVWFEIDVTTATAEVHRDSPTTSF
jgi:anti-sigma regulatory factor (Ser/Thr protein kinase)